MLQQPKYTYLLKVITPIVAFGCLLGIFMAQTGIIGAASLMAIPFAIIFLVILFKNPHYGLYTVMYLGFFSNGISRYSTAPLGLSIDIVLLLSLFAAFFKLHKKDYELLKNPFVYGISIWALFTIFEIVNPQSRSMAAWFFAVRGVSLYMVQLVVLTVLLMNNKDKLYTFLNIWIGWSFLACLWAMKQIYVGLNQAEKIWLDAGAYKTHILFGKLRAFSFYSDAGQFGAAMGHILLICLILATGPFKLRQKLLYWALAVFFFWGMAISGTRGALFVPLMGIMCYLFLSKNFKILSMGILIVTLLFSALKFTKIGQGNYQIQRMRSALDPNEPSLQVRLENQKKLKVYLANKPFGGGIGSAGYWGQRFSPGTFLAETPTDSWYVKIWAETGIVGLYIHLSVILSFIISGVICIFKMKNDAQLRQITIAIFSGFVGVAFASYGNQVLGQSPSSIVVFMSLGFVWLAYKWDQQTNITTITKL